MCEGKLIEIGISGFHYLIGGGISFVDRDIGDVGFPYFGDLKNP